MYQFEEININKTNIDSITAFLNIKNNILENTKNVYFIEIYGFDNKNDLINDIIEIDNKFNNNTDISYTRTSNFPENISYENSLYYSENYEKINNLKFTMSDFIQKRYEYAFNRIKNIFIKNNSNANETIIKNFMIKIMYWSDFFFEKIFKNENKNFTYKFVYCGNLKKQEYMFLHFLCLMGIDILYINTEKNNDFNIKFGYEPITINHNKFGKIDIPQNIVRKNTKININDTKKDTKTKNNSDNNNNIKIDLNNIRKVRKYDKDLNFEELALLGSKVVMINVIDENGEYFKSGSGFFISSKGFILTNFHVLNGGYSFDVRIENDENIYEAENIIKYDYINDIAILKIEKSCEPLKIYNSQTPLLRGQKVVAIGSPLGFFNTVSDGIISGFRNIEDTEFIQFTAPVSKGSSGGALLNIRGEVIGITTGGFDDGQNINIAVSYNIINKFIKGFI